MILPDFYGTQIGTDAHVIQFNKSIESKFKPIFLKP